MSLSAVFGSALSAMQVNQTALAVTSSNITNANTPGYARQVVHLSPMGGGADVGLGGVRIDDIERVADDFLTASARAAMGAQERADGVFTTLDRAQASFGDPTSGTSLFDDVSTMFSTFGLLASEASSQSTRTQLLSDIQGVLDSVGRVEQNLGTLRRDVSAQIDLGVTRVNELLALVPGLNSQIQAANALDTTSGAEDDMAQVLDEIAGLLDIRTSRRDDGSYEVRTPDGQLLAGTVSATLTYADAGGAAPGQAYEPITISYPGVPEATLDGRLTGGLLDGLLELRDETLPELGLQLGEFSAGVARVLNRESNQNVSFPPPTSLTGADVGLQGTDSLGFSGQTTLSLLSADGELTQYFDIDFDAGTIAVDGTVSTTTFTAGGTGTIAEFVTAFNTVTGGAATASFANGALAIDGGTNGLAFSQDADDPSVRGGQGFSEFFRLNDILESSSPISYTTGISATDPHGFTNGETITLRLTDDNNVVLAQPTVTIAGTSMQDVLNDLNDATGGLGAYGTFALDADGALSFTPVAGREDTRLFVDNDTTQRVGSSLGFSGLFGLGNGPRTERAATLVINPDFSSDTNTLPLGRIDRADASFAVGNVVTGGGDTAGAQALQAAELSQISFEAAGGLAETTTSLSDYAARLLGDVGSRSATAEREVEAAGRLSTETAARRASVEGVNIDEELINLTKYQQAYQAASRLIQVSQEMLDTLLSIV